MTQQSTEPRVGDKMPDDASRVNHQAAHASEPIEASIGAVMKDGTVFAGISPDTKKPMYTISVDAQSDMSWREAVKYASKRDCYGYRDWRVPTKGELNVLFNNRAAIGGFKSSPFVDPIYGPEDFYWSSSAHSWWSAWGQRFSDGDQSHSSKLPGGFVRLVRTKAPKPT
jgi:hypothetical protein